MIIKCKVRAGPTQLAAYLLNNDKNERAELLEMRGFRRNLAGALSLEEEVAHTQTRCEKPFYHVAFAPAPGETLTPEQWQHCADKFEQAVGLEGHNRALVMHTHEGEQHLHVVWSRLDPETLEATNLYRDHYRANATARELERELGLQQVRDRAPERELEPPTFNEDQQARRKGQKLDEARDAIREAWEESDNGKSFAAALKERGLTLAHGDRRDFVAVDEAGSVYTIGKRTTGARAAEVREKLADLDREDMPTVDQVREQQRAERGREQEQEQRREDQEPEKERPEDRAERQDAAQEIPDLRRVVTDLRYRKERQDAYAERRREQERREQREEKAPEPIRATTPEREIAALDKGAGDALGTVAGGALKALDGFLDLFIGAPPKPPPRQKTIAELDAEDKAAKRDELERMKRMTDEEREREKRERREGEGRERERERER